VKPKITVQVLQKAISHIKNQFEAISQTTKLTGNSVRFRRNARFPPVSGVMPR